MIRDAELLTLADLPPRDPAELRAAVADIDEDELLTAGISPHAPYTVPEAHLRAAIALAQDSTARGLMYWRWKPLQEGGPPFGPFVTAITSTRM